MMEPKSQPIVPIITTYHRLKSPLKDRKPENGITTSLGMGKQALSKVINIKSPEYPILLSVSTTNSNKKEKKLSTVQKTP